MRRDRIANEKIIDFFPPEACGIGTSISAVWDLRAGIPVVGAPSAGAGREIPTNILLSLSVAAGWGALGTLDLSVQTGDLTTSLVAYATGAQCLATELEDLYLFEFRDLQRYMRVDIIVGGAACTLCVIGNAERSRREPVFQAGTEKVVTILRSPAATLTGP